MRDYETTEEDSASEIAVPVVWRVVAVRPLPGFQLEVEFADGLRGRFDYSAFIHREDAGVFIPLRDVNFFKRVGNEHGAVSWPGEIDLAPDAMYARLKASGANTIVKR
jgi:hypothetical protein